MKWSLRELSSLEQPLQISKTLDLKADLMSRHSGMVLSASPFRIKASVDYSFGKAILKTRVSGKLEVPSSRSLIPVALKLNFKFKEIYVADKYDLKLYNQNHPHNEDTVLTVGPEGLIDLNKAVADNIMLQIPMKVLSPEEKASHTMPKGKGWQVISEDEYNHPKAKRKTVDPRLAKLKDYFKK